MEKRISFKKMIKDSYGPAAIFCIAMTVFCDWLSLPVKQLLIHSFESFCFLFFFFSMVSLRIQTIEISKEKEEKEFLKNAQTKTERPRREC